MSIPTVQIHDPNNSTDYIIINERDFDPTVATLWDPENPPQERGAAILDAIRRLIEEDVESAFTTTGLPKVPALEEILGHDITAEERDGAWIEYTDQ